ncbi:MAG: DUF4433 domain-containing protein [Candidatus Eremiobacterota bacterium]|mgnify:CR=1 FL=1
MSSEFSRIIDEKHIKGLYHFTELSNLKGIFNSPGLLSRINLKKSGLLSNIMDSASNEIIKRRETVKLFNGKNLSEYVPLYFARRSPMLYVTEGIKTETDRYPHTITPVYLVFSPSVLLAEGVIFADGNASSSRTTIGEGPEALMSVDMDIVRTPMTSIKYKYSNMVYREVKRKKQAEALIPDMLPLQYLMGICFRCEAEMKEGERLLGDSLKKYNYRVFPDMFHRHRAYVEDFRFDSNLDLVVQMANTDMSHKLSLRFFSDRGDFMAQLDPYKNYKYNSGKFITYYKNGRMDFFINHYRMFSVEFEKGVIKC